MRRRYAMSRVRGVVVLCAATASAATLGATSAGAQDARPLTSLESVTAQGGAGDGVSNTPSLSADGRYVAFQSSASNLVTGDTNGVADVFVRDRQTGTVTRVSVGAGGAQADASSGEPAISADGRFVAFSSNAANLVAGDTNNRSDIFVRDLVGGSTERISVTATGAQAQSDSETPSVSADGRYVAFDSDASELTGRSDDASQVLVRDRRTGSLETASAAPAGSTANASSSFASISADGRYVAFESAASNLVADDTNSREDVFVRDMKTGTTRRASLSASDTQLATPSFGASISGDGQRVAFTSISINGSSISFDVWVRDLSAGSTRLASVATNGQQADGNSFLPSMSRDGRYVVFTSYAANLDGAGSDGDADVYVRDLKDERTRRISVSPTGTDVSGSSGAGSLSADGRFVAFESDSSELVTNDANAHSDIFVRGPLYLLPQTGPAPTVQGGAVGETLRATVGTWAAQTTLTYQWFRGEVPIKGATSLTYKVVPSDLNQLIMFVVTAERDGYETTSRNATAVQVVMGQLDLTTPKISGTAKVGKTLKAVPGRWTSGTTLSYQWRANGKNIARATKASFKLTSKQRGKQITVKVTGKKTGYQTAARTSSKTPTVK